jgi:hypothetical protein
MEMNNSTESLPLVELSAGDSVRKSYLEILLSIDPVEDAELIKSHGGIEKLAGFLNFAKICNQEN